VILALVGIALFFIDSNRFQIFWIVTFGLAVLLVVIYFSIKKWNKIVRFFSFEKSVGGIVRFYGKRSDFNWKAFFHKYTSPPQEVIFMGQSLAKAFSDPEQVKLFAEWCNAGTKFKILLLSPSNSNSQQLRSVGEGMKDPSTDQPQQNLVNKIKLTITEIENNLIENIKDIKNQPYVRFSTVDLPFSFTMIDNDMVVTTYTTEPEADTLPTFIIKGKKKPAFEGLKREFESIWEKRSVVLPYKDIVTKENLKNWEEFLKLKKSYYGKTPVTDPPKQAIIYPTYRCSNSCGHCMYKEKKGDDSLSGTNFRNILEQLLQYGVTHIEISGGGEPLETPYLKDIMKELMSIRKQYPKVRFGLLTNGLHLEKSLKKYDLLHIFNDYIRVSRLIEKDLDITGKIFSKEEKTWHAGINLLCETKNQNKQKYNSTKIGLKYLLSSKNKESFADEVRKDTTGKFLDKFDHIRFRSERTVDSDIIYPIEQEVYRTLKGSEKIKNRFEEKIALSLSNIHYPQNWRCWISPIHVVIDPIGDVYTCCNYIVEPKTHIGNVLTTPFITLWEGESHINARQALSKEICNCKEYCTNCRFAELQFNYEHIIATLGYDYVE